MSLFASGANRLVLVIEIQFWCDSMIQLTDAMIETQSFVLNCFRDYLVKEVDVEEMEVRYVSFSSRDFEVVSWVHHCRIIS